MSAFETKYKEIAKQLQVTHNYKNVMMIPKVSKITINMGVGEAALDKKHLTTALTLLAKIAGQKPIATMARNSIAGFKIREGWPIGGKVTLRGRMMFEFLERLITIAIPRIRDFRGLKSNFDGRGNYSMGIKDLSVFPEISYEDMDIPLGLSITITTTAITDAEAKSLLLGFNLPLKDK